MRGQEPSIAPRPKMRARADVIIEILAFAGLLIAAKILYTVSSISDSIYEHFDLGQSGLTRAAARLILFFVVWVAIFRLTQRRYLYGLALIAACAVAFFPVRVDGP